LTYPGGVGRGSNSSRSSRRKRDHHDSLIEVTLVGVIGERSSVFEITLQEENLRENLVVLVASNENLAKICIKRDDCNILDFII
jgi:hypothetical protein